MAEKTEKKAEAPPSPEKKGEAKPAASGGGGLMGKTPVLVGAVMLIEAVVLFAGFKFLGGGAHNANGADLTTQATKTADGDKSATASAQDDTLEIPLLDMKFPNKISGRTFLYDVSIFVSVKSTHADAVKKIIADRDALIKDRVRTIIAQSDPEKLGGGSEPGLETLRRQVKYQLDEICGEGMVEDVLIPRCIPYRADF
jgi:flagellar basal body-associated protein FliL